jgi:light-regulated signal transduction histidine kinase (bacteriophytochrome)
MPIVEFRATTPCDPLTEPVMRSERILRSMHKVFSHDLPNQMVALQGLLELLSSEEAHRLSEDGREYVRRLQNATQRATEMVRFLKEMERVHTSETKVEPVALQSFARELRGGLQQKFPGKTFEFHWDWRVSVVQTDVRVLLNGVLELCTCFLSRQESFCRIRASSHSGEKCVELAFQVEEVEVKSEPGPHLPRWNQHAVEQRPEVILAREWLALAGAELQAAPPVGGRANFCIAVSPQ